MWGGVCGVCDVVWSVCGGGWSVRGGGGGRSMWGVYHLDVAAEAFAALSAAIDSRLLLLVARFLPAMLLLLCAVLQLVESSSVGTVVVLVHGSVPLLALALRLLLLLLLLPLMVVQNMLAGVLVEGVMVVPACEAVPLLPQLLPLPFMVVVVCERGGAVSL